MFCFRKILKSRKTEQVSGIGKFRAVGWDERRDAAKDRQFRLVGFRVGEFQAAIKRFNNRVDGAVVSGMASNRDSPGTDALSYFLLLPRATASLASLSAVLRRSVSRLSHNCLPLANASSTFTRPFLK